ncbi:1395_t:CDS:2 [Racocetra fulgida]|uniref:1395_t:CDS:1 n=1 Tax=Racocetra fulgida TaxID=60492 RepID=A0A9N9F364_9GLOM|nr:1395_t:CDS:2 [Racocetra fulgida]
MSNINKLKSPNYMSFELTEINTNNNMSLEYIDPDTNMYTEVTEIQASFSMSFELAESEATNTNTALSTLEPAVSNQNRVGRKRSSSKLAKSTMSQDAENIETAREPYARRKSILINLQLEQRYMQCRNVYAQQTETESIEKAEERRSKRRKLNILASYSAQVAVLMVESGDDSEPLNHDIILRKHRGGLQRISQICSSYSPLHYHPNIPACIEPEDVQSNDNDETFNISEDGSEEETQQQTQNPNLLLSDDEIENRALCLVDDLLLQQGKSLKDFPNMPIPIAGNEDENSLIAEELTHDKEILAEFVDCYENLLNDDQKKIIHDCNNSQELIDFVYPELQLRSLDANYLLERGILAPRNVEVDELNSEVLAQFPVRIL